jgi:hypothetical protein
LDVTVKTRDGNVSATAPGAAADGLQPFLHDAVVTLHAPSFVISRADGQVTGGADGFFHGDSRALARLTVAADGITLAPVSGALQGADRADFRAVLRGLGEVTEDPVVALHRRRGVTSGGLEETFEVTNAGVRPVRFRLTMEAATDLAPMDKVKSGQRLDGIPAQATAGGLVWSREGLTVRLLSTPAPDTLDATAGRLSYDIDLAPSQSRTVLLACTAAPTDGDQCCAAPTGAWTAGCSSRSPTWTGCA